MPEGPTIVILKEHAQQFTGHKILSVSGNRSADIFCLENKVINEFKSWGKHFLICVDSFTVKIHLLKFGTYRINERKNSTPRMSLVFENGELNFYTFSIKILKGDCTSLYDWTEDVMNSHWNSEKAKQHLENTPNKMICDALLDENIFCGVGNIIKMKFYTYALFILNH